MDLFGNGWGKMLLLALLAGVYPVHGVFRTPTVAVNLSIGDPIIALVGLLFLFGVFGPVTLPKLTLTPIILFIPVVLSVLVNSIQPELELTASLLESVKLAASGMWGVSVAILLSRSPRKGLWLLTLTSVCVAIGLSLPAVIQGLVFGVARPAGPFENPNLFADYLLFNIFLLLLLADWKFGRIIRKPVALTGLGVGVTVILIALIGTSSRSAFAALIIGLLFSVNWVSRIRTSLAQTLGMITTGCFGLIGSLFLLQSQGRSMVSRFAAAFNGEQTGSRDVLWSRSFDAFLSEPVFGVGWGQLQYTIDTSGIPITTHNTALRFFVESGSLGGIAFLVFSLLIIRESLRLRFTDYPHVRFLGGYFVAAFANSLFHDIINFRSFWIAFALLCGFLLLATHENSKS